MSEAADLVSFKYDYLGRRVEAVFWDYDFTGAAWIERWKKRYVYDGWHLIAEIDVSAGVSGLPVTSTYFWGYDISSTIGGIGAIGGLLMVDDGTDQYLTSADARGNVVLLINEASGSVAATFEYGPYGQTLRKEGAYDKVPFRYQTKWDLNYGFESGGMADYLWYQWDLIDYGLRWYQPSNGRFINRDPIGEAGGLNLYEAFLGDPINGRDFLGLDCEGHPRCGPPGVSYDENRVLGAANEAGRISAIVASMDASKARRDAKKEGGYWYGGKFYTKIGGKILEIDPGQLRSAGYTFNPGTYVISPSSVGAGSMSDSPDGSSVEDMADEQKRSTIIGQDSGGTWIMSPLVVTTPAMTAAEAAAYDRWFAAILQITGGLRPTVSQMERAINSGFQRPVYQGPNHGGFRGLNSRMMSQGDRVGQVIVGGSIMLTTGGGAAKTFGRVGVAVYRIGAPYAIRLGSNAVTSLSSAYNATVATVGQLSVRYGPEGIMAGSLVGVEFADGFASGLASGEADFTLSPVLDTSGSDVLQQGANFTGQLSGAGWHMIFDFPGNLRN